MNSPQQIIPVQWSEVKVSGFKIRRAGITARLLKWPQFAARETGIASAESPAIFENWCASPTSIDRRLQPLWPEVAESAAAKKGK